MTIAESNQEKNIKNLYITLNKNSLPYDKTKEEREWDAFKFLVYENIKSRLTNIILRMYKWTLPDTMEERIIEQGFLRQGYITVFKDVLGFFALPCIPNGFYNIYGEPTQVSAYGYNGWNKIINIKRFKELPQIEGFTPNIKKSNIYGVVARDNYDNKKYIDYIEEYSKILTDNRMAILVATDTLKQPRIVAVAKKALQKTAQKFIKGIRENKREIIVVNESIKDTNGIKDIMADIDLSGNIEAPKKLVEIYNANFNLFLETIGINTNPSPDKSEVVLNAELASNNSLIDLEQDVRFLNRLKLCEDAKKILGVEMKVEKNIQETNQLINQMKIGGNENGTAGTEPTAK